MISAASRSRSLRPHPLIFLCVCCCVGGSFIVVPYVNIFSEFADSMDVAIAASPVHSGPKDIYAFLPALTHALFTGLWLEFGVWQGGSTRFLENFIRNSAEPVTKIYGFDAFHGLPENWRPTHGDAILERFVKKGSFDIGGIPPYKETENIKWVVGWYNESLAKWIDLQPSRTISFIHIDCDIYSSTKTVFDVLGKDIAHSKSVIMVFDELYGYPEYRENELLALWELMRDLSSTHKTAVDVIHRNKNNTQAVALRFVSLPLHTETH